MTESPKILSHKKTLVFTIIALIILLLLFAKQTTAGIHKALQLCASTVIPSLFPFMVASDLLMACQVTDIPLPRLVEKSVKKVFRVSPYALYPFLLGSVCGFPIGIKSAADLYHAQKLSSQDTEKCICFCNNTGPAFVIAGVGASLFSSVRLGILLYAIQILSALICALIFAHTSTHIQETKPSVFLPPRKQSLNFVEAVQNSIQSILAVCGFILVFASITEVATVFCKNRILLSFFSSFLEIGGAVSLAADLFLHNPFLGTLCACMAINFGGLSVHLQSAYFLKDIPVSFFKYLFAKLIQTAVSSLVLIVVFPFLFSICT